MTIDKFEPVAKQQNYSWIKCVIKISHVLVKFAEIYSTVSKLILV